MTGLNFTKKEYEEIFKKSITDAQEYELLSESDNFLEKINNLEDIENFNVLTLAVHSFIDAKLYEDAEIIDNNRDLDKASSEGLDSLGKLFGIIRPEAKRSTAGLVFSLPRSIDDDVIIPEGTLVSTSDGIYYATYEEKMIPQGSTSVNVVAYSVETGYDTLVGSNRLTKILDNINSYGVALTVNNPSNTVGGANAMSDNVYRELIRNWTKVLTRGTEECYEEFFANYEGIDGYRLIPHWNGAGTLKIVIDTPREILHEIILDLVEQLSSHVNQFNDDDVVIVPTEIKVVNNINLHVNVDIDRVIDYSLPEKEDIQLRIKNSVKTYINGGTCVNGDYYKGLEIGEDFIPHKCAVFLDKEIPEIKNIIFDDDSHFEIGDYEQASCGDVNVTIE